MGVRFKRVGLVGTQAPGICSEAVGLRMDSGRKGGVFTPSLCAGPCASRRRFARVHGCVCSAAEVWSRADCARAETAVRVGGAIDPVVVILQRVQLS